jgi:hypothetical protein
MVKNSEFDATFKDDARTPIILGDDLKKVGKMKTGSIRVFHTVEDQEQAVFRKQENGEWVIADSKLDVWIQLTKEMNSDKLQDMSEIRSLIPQADKLYDNGFNVLLIGLHGTGKTESIKRMCEERGLKMKYFSCSTLDPFTDLVGVPVPKDTRVDGEAVTDEHGDTKQHLQMIRPREIDEADIIFFDELNRADAKTLNAVFEIVQFKSINGEKLPNLKVCWAAINPPDEDYDVDRLDKALLDRFDVYINIDPKPDVKYMAQYMPIQHAKVLYNWWNEHKKDVRSGVRDEKMDYISPRRLLKLGLIWNATSNMRLIKAAMPMDGTFDVMKLVNELRSADESIRRGDKVELPDDDVVEDDEATLGNQIMGQKAYDGFQYELKWLRANTDEVVQVLTENPGHFETHNAISTVFEGGIGGIMLVEHYHKILNALNPQVLEGLAKKFPVAKRNHLRVGFKNLMTDKPQEAKNAKNLYTVLGGEKELGKL